MKIELDDMAVILADSIGRVKNVLDEEMPKDDVEFFMGIVGATIWDALQHAYDQRGFEVAKGFNPDDVTLPERSTSGSAGYDFFSTEDVIIPPHKSIKINTGVKAYMLSSESLEIYIRSSVAIKRNLMLTNQVALIDSDYYGNPENDGAIVIGLYNFGDEPQEIKKGDKIAQGVFRPYLNTGDEPTEARSGGIGSTGI